LHAYGKTGFSDSTNTPSYTDGDGNPYQCCSGQGLCPQHAAQRQLDLTWLGYIITVSRINRGVYAHLSVS
jgi:hypothetical protein